MFRILARARTAALAIAAASLTAGCAVPQTSINVTPEALTLVAGGTGTVTAVAAAECDPSDTRPCLDPAGQIFGFLVEQVPAGVSYYIDTSLQSPGTPGVVRIEFAAEEDVTSGVSGVVLIHAVLDGRVAGSGEFLLTVLPALPSRLPPASAISANRDAALALLADGRVAAWGENGLFQLGRSDASGTPTLVPGLGGIIAIDAGSGHSLAVDGGGRVWAWGGNITGTLGTGAPPSMVAAPALVPGLADIREVAAGDHHSLALDTGGAVWAWGVNGLGELGLGDERVPTMPERIPQLPLVVAIAAAHGASLAVTDDGTVWFWGYGPLGSDHAAPIRAPSQVAGLSGIRAVATNGDTGLALADDGRVWAWGDNTGGLLGEATPPDHTAPIQIDGLESIVAVSLSADRAAALDADGRVWQWGKEEYYGDGTDGGLHLVPDVSGATAIAAGGRESFALLACGQVRGWAGRATAPPGVVVGIGDDSGCDLTTVRIRIAGDIGPIGGLLPDVIHREDGPLLQTHGGWLATLPVGTPVTLMADPSINTADDLPVEFANLVFERWAGDCSGTEPRMSLTPNRAYDCVAIYRESDRPGRLGVTAVGGTVTSFGAQDGIFGPRSLSCGDVCDAIFPGGSLVGLRAAADEGFTFTHWSGDCSGDDPITRITVQDVRSCRAHFRPYALDVTVTGEGRVTSDPAGIDCGPTCTTEPRAGTVTLTALADEGWQFASWSGDCAGIIAQTVVAMDRDKQCSAAFVRLAGLRSLRLTVEGSGSVVSTPPGIACPPNCEGFFSQGSAVDLTAQPAPGHTLSFWFEDCGISNAATVRVVMDADRQCIARFTGQPAFPVASFSHSSSFVTIVGEVVTFDGLASHVYDPVTQTQDPAGISVFIWDFDGDDVSDVIGSRSAAAVAQVAFQAAGSYRVRLRVRGGPFDLPDDIESTLTVVEDGEPLSTLTVAKAGTGSGAIVSQPPGLIDCPATCQSAGPLLIHPFFDVTLVAQPAAGSSFAGWTGVGCGGTAPVIVIDMIAARTCTATFTAGPPPTPTLTVIVNGPATSLGRIESLAPAGLINCGVSGGTCTATLPVGTPIVLRPDTASLELLRFGGWVGCDSVGVLFSCTVTINGPRTVTATFTQ